jgi:cytosine/adenosine deaminase-related metal-dependent hydrolase
MTVYRAAWLCPIASPPIRDGWLAVDGERITHVGAPGESPPFAARDLGRVAVMPGLVNAHTHLELSYLRDRVPPAADFVSWVKQLILSRGPGMERPDDPAVLAAARRGALDARESGTVAVGDISNSLATIDPIRDAGLCGLVFHELLGFDATDGRLVEDGREKRAGAAARGAERVRVSVCPHAPYSVSSALFRAIRAEVNGSGTPITSVHLGESASEIEMLADGGGPWPGMLRFIGKMPDAWRPPGVGPVEYLDALGMLDARTLVVHGVQLRPSALERLAAIGCTLVTCPRSNQWVGVGAPPVERFYASGARVAIGTDSLASVADLNLFSELKTMRWLAPHLPAGRLLESATRSGAAALGLESDLGTIEPGKRAELISIDLPPQVVDVEEYLVSGITPGAVRWIAS